MFKNSILIEKAKVSKFKPNIVLQLLIFSVVFISISVATTVILIIPLMKIMLDSGIFALVTSPNADFGEVYRKAMEISTSEKVLILSLFATVCEIVLPVIYCRFIEKRPLSSMGFVKRGAVKNYLLGYLIGALMLGASVGICAAFGSVKIKLSDSIPVGIIIVFFLGFLIQGAAEEVLCRGYLMLSIAGRYNVAVAVGVSSVVFSLLHLANPGVTVLALVNIALFGVVMALYVLRTNCIWGAAAMHSAWNFFQGNIFGIQVSGNSNTSSVLVSEADTRAFINGGDFGIEGGVAVTVVLVIALLLIIFLPKNKTQTKSDCI